MAKYVVATVLTVALVVIGVSIYEPSPPEDHGLAALVEWQPSFESYFDCLVDSFADDPRNFSVDDDFYFEPGAGSELRFTLHDGLGHRNDVRYGEHSLIVIRPFRNQTHLLRCAN